MNELCKITNATAKIRKILLATTSAMALVAFSSLLEGVRAASDDHPSVWIELSGQFAHEQAGQEAYAPSFLAASPFGVPAADLQKSSPASWDGTAKFSFETDDRWIFSAALRYGKTSRNKTSNHQTAHASHQYSGQYVGGYDAYQLLRAKASESHTILDFQVGKEVGLGSFGNSVLSAGVRFAQFNADTNVNVQSQPSNVNGYGYYHVFRAELNASRHFNGVGPSVSWNVSTPIFGDFTSSSIALDWGINGAVLFGRQRVGEEHQTTDSYKHYFHYMNIETMHAGATRNRRVAVPGVGGFAGVSWHATDAKVTLGYRADLYFGAMDGGINARKTFDRGFYGPYAMISIGLGR